MILISREDNMNMMSRYPDKYFDLAIVDPLMEYSTKQQEEEIRNSTKVNIVNGI